mmetsp:Transcript_142941/g.398290  ORF Transcript_142941/g.398290 Transcript_142941/m.398290 type:complete len:197 (-) Transcript_142941:135-725(-)
MGFGDASAKDKKSAKSAAATAAATKAAEDASWEDGDKGAKAKAARAAAKEDKADAKLQAKKEREELEAAENEAMSKLSGANKKAPTKVTQAEIARRQALLAMAKPKAAPKTVKQPKLEENKNRKVDEIEASGVDAALAALDVGGTAKPSKMTYAEFERMNINAIKEENPGLKQSQLKDHCWKMWERSPENPKNQEK